MTDNQLKSLDDIVFEHKNKNYGAYDLRKTEKGYLLKAFLVGTIVFVLFVLLLFFYNQWQAKKAAGEKGVDVELKNIDTPKEDKKEEILEQKKEPPPPPVKKEEVAQVKVIMPEPKKTVIKEETIPKFEDTKDKNLGDKDVQGKKTGDQDTSNAGKEQKGEEKPQQKVSDNTVFDNVEVEAAFKGKGGINSFLASNLEYTDKAVDNGTEGKITVKFIVEKDGSVTNAQVIGKKLGDGLDEQAIKAVLKTSKQWTPGKVNDQPVRSYFRVPITFRLPQ